MKRLIILLLGLLVAGGSYAFTDLGTVDVKAEVFNVADYHSQDVYEVTVFDSKTFVNIDHDYLTVKPVDVLSSYVYKVEGRERGSPELTINIPKTNNYEKDSFENLTKSRYWRHRTSETKYSIVVDYFASNWYIQHVLIA